MFFRRAPQRKVMVIGLGCAGPELVFHRWPKDLPNPGCLLQAGVGGSLRGMAPPMIVPAWMYSRDPGKLDLHSFRNRGDFSDDKLALANPVSIQEETLWDGFGLEGGAFGIAPLPPMQGAAVRASLARAV